MRVIKEWKFKPTDDMTVPQYHLYQKWIRDNFISRKIHYSGLKMWQFDDLYFNYRIKNPPKEIERFIELEYCEIPDEPKILPWYKKLC